VDFTQEGKDHDLPRDGWRLDADTVDMAREKTDNHLKAWRKFRKLTQQQLADRIEPPTTKQVIQALESGQNGLSDKWLRKLAPALGTTPGFLLDYDPNDIDGEIIAAAQDVAQGNREQVLQILRTFKTGTVG
jgi:transcriptional regulator with XRE-family HTH domain